MRRHPALALQRKERHRGHHEVDEQPASPTGANASAPPRIMRKTRHVHGVGQRARPGAGPHRLREQ
eukprot:2028592-Lingulodinium_polyedra.AAC.1